MVKILTKYPVLEITNTGFPLERPTHEMFHRFAKRNNSRDSIGLGLPIIKQICENYQYNIFYTYTENTHADNTHAVTIDFHTMQKTLFS